VSLTDRRLVPLLVMTVVLGLTVVACGDDDGGDADAKSGGETPAAARLPEAKQSPAAFARELADLVAESVTRRECKQLDAINLRSVYRFPCPQPENVRADLAFLKVRDAASYGTGAVVDYRSEEAPRGASMVLFLGPDRQWGIGHYNLITEASAESSDEESREGYAEAIAAYLEAVRERDCKGYTQWAAIRADDVKAACKGELARFKPLTEMLKRNPDDKPEYLGGSETYGFYRLEVDEPRPAYMTFTIFKTPKGSLRPYLVQPPTFAPGR
jgi:hypothetical protein